MRLDEYRKKEKLSQDGFGKQLTPHASQALISQWELGDTAITLTRALNIQEVTGGEVSVQDCADMYKSKEAAA